MAKFTSELVLVPSEASKWKLEAPLSYESDLMGPLNVIAGFETDLASIPKLFWNIMPPFGTYTKAAVLHDWLYSCGREGLNISTREQADRVLLEAMEACGTGYFTRQTIFRAVRLFGGPNWKIK